MKRINLFFLFIITTLFACENTNQNTTSAEVVAEERVDPIRRASIYGSGL